MKERDYTLCTTVAQVRDAEAVLRGLIAINGVVSDVEWNALRTTLREIRLRLEAAIHVRTP